ncbi:MAG: VWA domain-containing protein, partial [Pseudomonadota bacterium]
MLVLLGLFWFPWNLQAAAPPEIHTLVDVSGSMKETDPDNLRAPALRLLAELMSERSRVRVDRFGRDVATLLPAAPADADTRATMRRVAARLPADEPLTDIPAALEHADTGWHADGERHVILVSDGKVDVGDQASNRQATERLREEVIPRLASRSVRVHTVALSEKADGELLAEIADRTDGLAITAHSSADLQRAFLALFEATAPRAGLPLVDNRLRVDDGVRELTLLIFRDTDVPTRIRLPDGDEVTASMASERSDWRWDDSAGRDLITV